MANLIHPIPVLIEIWATGLQVMDIDAREPIHGIRGNAVVSPSTSSAVGEPLQATDDPNKWQTISKPSNPEQVAIYISGGRLTSGYSASDSGLVTFSSQPLQTPYADYDFIPAATSVQIPAQIHWNKNSAPIYNPSGVVQSSDGYILVRRADMRARNVVFKRGDKITQIGAGMNQDNMPNPLYITGEQPLGHTPGARGSELVKYMFEDRNPGATP